MSFVRLLAPGAQRRVSAALLVAAVLAAATGAMAAPAADEPLDAVTAAAQQALSAWLGTRSTRHALRPLTTADAGAVPLRVRPPADDASVDARMTVWVELRQPDGSMAMRPVSFAVRAWAWAWSPRRALPVGAPIAAAEWTRAETDVSGQPGAMLAALPDAARLRLPMRAGEPLQARHVDATDGVRRGDRVAVRIRRGPLDVEAAAESLHDAATGREVWVRLAGATGPVRGRVAAPGRVEVTP